MSYSFSVSTNTKEDADRQIREQFDAVVQYQPSHSKDREAVVVAAQTLIGLLAEPTEHDEIHVAMHGSLGWNYDAPDEITNANVNITVMMRRCG